MFELRNTTEVNKKIELSLVGTAAGGIDAGYAGGAISQTDQKVMGCLGPVLKSDSIYFNYFPTWNPGSWEPSLDYYFDVEINGVVYDFSLLRGFEFGLPSEYPDELKPITELIRICQGTTGINRLFIRNLTQNILNVKLLKRDPLNVSINQKTQICDDGKNTTTIYHDNGDIEFILEPLIPFDQVQDKDKMILEVTYNADPTDPTFIEPMYFEVILARNSTHKDDYFYVDWGDGTLTHYRFIDFVDSSDWNKTKNYAFWDTPNLQPGKRLIKIHTSHPIEYLMIQNVSAVKQWGRYVFEGVYGFDSRYLSSEESLLKEIPAETPSWLSDFSMDTDGFNPTTEVNVTDIASIWTSLDLIDQSGITAENDYGYYNQFIDYNNYIPKFNNGHLTWGKYPEEYPCLGFEDLDQLALHFTTHAGGGSDLNILLDHRSDKVGNFIGVTRPANISAYIQFIKIENKDEYIYLIDLKKYKSDGKSLSDLLLYIRAFWSGDVISGRVILNMQGWLNSAVTLGLGGLENKPAINNFETILQLNCKRLTEDSSGPGEAIGLLHYDPWLEMVTGKTMKYSKLVNSTIAQDDASLDVVLITGEPGSIYKLEMGYTNNDTGVKTNEFFEYTLDDNGKAEHRFDFIAETHVSANSVSLKNPIQFIDSPEYNQFDKAARSSERRIPLDVFFTIDGVAITDVSLYENKDQYINVDFTKLVAGKHVRSNVIYKSAKTGKIYTLPAHYYYEPIVPFIQEDLFIMKWPFAAFASMSSPVFSVNGENVNALARVNTPGEPPKLISLTRNVSSGRAHFTISSASWNAINSSPSAFPLVEFIIYETATCLPPKAALDLRGGTNLHYVTQFGTQLNSFGLGNNSPNNLPDVSALPSVLPKSITNLTDLLYGKTNINAATAATVAGWDVSHVINFSRAFQSSNFNGAIGVWNTKSAINMGAMVRYNTVFNQDLSQWCVPGILTAPVNFAQSATQFLSPKHPVWGTCPRGENLV